MKEWIRELFQGQVRYVLSFDAFFIFLYPSIQASFTAKA
jgi:hypothetical protein